MATQTLSSHHTGTARSSQLLPCLPDSFVLTPPPPTFLFLVGLKDKLYGLLPSWTCRDRSLRLEVAFGPQANGEWFLRVLGLLLGLTARLTLTGAQCLNSGVLETWPTSLPLAVGSAWK